MSDEQGVPMPDRTELEAVARAIEKAADDRVAPAKGMCDATWDAAAEAAIAALDAARSTQPEGGEAVSVDYTNWKGERATRAILPSRLWFGASEHHPDPQWLLNAWDCEKDAMRTFALCDVHSWRADPEVPVESTAARSTQPEGNDGKSESNDHWFHEVGFMASRDLEVIEMVESFGGEYVYGRASHDPDGERQRATLEAKPALAEVRHAIHDALKVLGPDATGCETTVAILRGQLPDSEGSEGDS